jgi:hypothetical protein
MKIIKKLKLKNKSSKEIVEVSMLVLFRFIIFAIILMTLIGCSQKGELIYPVILKNIQNGDYLTAWQNLDSLRQINPKFHKNDTTIAKLQDFINIPVLEKCNNLQSVEKITITNADSLIKYLELLSKYSPNYPVTVNGVQKNVSDKLRDTPLLLANKTLDNMGKILEKYKINPSKSIFRGGEPNLEFESVDALRSQISSDSSDFQMYSQLLTYINKDSYKSCIDSTSSEWQKLIEIKAKETKIAEANKLIEIIGVWSQSSGGDYGGKLGYDRRDNSYTFNKDKTYAYHDQETIANGYMRDKMVEDKKGTWSFDGKTISLNCKKIRKEGHVGDTGKWEECSDADNISLEDLGTMGYTKRGAR